MDNVVDDKTDIELVKDSIDISESIRHDKRLKLYRDILDKCINLEVNLNIVLLHLKKEDSNKT